MRTRSLINAAFAVLLGVGTATAGTTTASASAATMTRVQPAAAQGAADVTEVNHRGHRRWHRGHRGHGPRWHRGGPSFQFHIGPRRHFRGHVYRPPVRAGGAAHVRWCHSRYRSYRAWDNSWQPYNGPRRQCRSPYR